VRRWHRASQTRPFPGIEDDANQEFDSVYPDWVRSQSHRQWTSVAVAVRAARLLVTNAYTRVLDVGAGAGKFCIAAALTTRHGRFYGVEQRADLVDVARDAAQQFGVAQRVHFVHGNITDIDWRQFNAFYFYNPFQEPVDLRSFYIQFTRAQLAAAPVGTRVVTYYGFGGAFPPGYRCLRREGRGAEVIELWEKAPTAAWLPPFEEDEPPRHFRLSTPTNSRPPSIA
jgi:SAM-dependent methyltransferase